MPVAMVESAASPSVRESKPNVPLYRPSAGSQVGGQHIKPGLTHSSQEVEVARLYRSCSRLWTKEVLAGFIYTVAAA